MWADFATIKPGLNWQLLDPFATGQTFRLTFPGLGQQIGSYVLIRQYFYNDVTRAIRAYPSTQGQIVELLVPKELEQAGETFRSIGVKRVFKKRYGFIQPDSDWSLKIEQWV